MLEKNPNNSIIDFEENTRSALNNFSCTFKSRFLGIIKEAKELI